MKKVIPEVVQHFCDRCGKEMNSRDIDCKGSAEFVGRDYTGCAVGGYTRSFELCCGCMVKFDNFLKGEDT